MGWLAAVTQQVRDMLSLPRLQDITPAYQFAEPQPRPVDQVIAEMLANGWGAKISRVDALSVAAVKRGRNELCAIATLPLRLYRGLDVVPSPLLRQIDPDVPNVVTMAATIEDLVFEGIAWWQVTGQDFDGYPVSARHIDAGRVSLKPPARKGEPTHTPSGHPAPGRASGPYVYVDGEPVSASLMIRFDSPNPGLLTADKLTVRRALLLGKVAAMYAENPQLREYFTDNPDSDDEPMTDPEVDAFLAEYAAMRKLRPVGWIPGNVQRVDVSAPSPAELQLVELQQQVTLELALALGLDPEDLAVRTTSRTYFNGVDRRQEKVNRTYAPYMKAITDRLSMGDVTRRGYETRFDLTDYLKSDPLTQVQYWRGLYDMGAIDSDEIRALAGFSGPAPSKPAPAPALPAANSWPPIILGDITPPRALPQRFDGEQLTFAVRDFAGVTPAPPKVDKESRTITGLAVPYNAVASKYGMKYRFKPGSLEYDKDNLSHLKHLKSHGSPVGVHLAVTDTAEGPVVKLSVLDGIEGSAEKMERDQLLYDAANGLYDGLSVGVEFSMYPEDGDVVFNEKDGVYDVVRATWRETSSTPLPAFTGARVTKVAASLQGGNQMDPCQHCGQRHAPGIACATFAAQLRTAQTPPAPPAQPGDPQPPAPGQSSPEALAAFAAAWQAFQARQLPSVPPSALPSGPPALPEQPTPVNPHHGPARVTEPAPYRFDRRGNLMPGSHDFSTDLLAGWRPDGSGDKAARDRANGWLRTVFADDDRPRPSQLWTPDGQFAVTPANVAALNPARNRPDMYVDQMEYEYPLWQAINKGSLDDVTPFVIPKFASSAGLVSDHTSGTEPTPGSFTATTQTITPSPVSGKVEILREALDQGGNPQMSGLIWRQMVRAYFEALEAYAVAQLVAVAAQIPNIDLTLAGQNDVLDQNLADVIVPLAYIRGGNRFRTVYTQIDLYTALAKAKDTAGRRLYPQIGPSNAMGTTEPRYAAIDAQGLRWLPAWALAASTTGRASSYMFDPEKVCGWASAPRQIDITWRVAWVDMGIWGYKAFGVTDFAGTREITYDRVAPEGV